MIDRLAPGLLGTHIGCRSQDHPRITQHHGRGERRRIRQIGLRRGVVRGFRQPEIEDLHLPLRRERDVRRLEVAVHNPFLVRRLEGIGNLPRDPNCVVKRQRALFEPLGERRAFDELEHEKARALLLLESMDLRDVRMIE